MTAPSRPARATLVMKIPMHNPDWYAVAGTVAAVGLGLIVLATLTAIGLHGAWSHQAAHAALAGFR